MKKSEGMEAGLWGSDFFEDHSIRRLLSGELASASFYQLPMQSYVEHGKSCPILSSLAGKKCLLLVDGTPKVTLQALPLDSDFMEFLKSFSCTLEVWNVSELLGTSELHASLTNAQKLRDKLKEHGDNGDVLIILGSGTLTDLVKAALWGLEDVNQGHGLHGSLFSTPTLCVSVPTALTVTAYTSHFAVLDSGGAKKTYLSRAPTHVVWSEQILGGAPWPMQRAGFGDLLARFTAFGDWKLGALLGLSTSVYEPAFHLMEGFSRTSEELALGLGRKNLNPQNWRCFCESLSLAGIAMSLSGETTPLSGFEHVISHGLDFLAMTASKELVLHGEQVALGTLVSSITFESLFSEEFLDYRRLLKKPSSLWDVFLRQLMKQAPVESKDKREWNQIDEARQSSVDLFLHEFVIKHENWLQKKDSISDLLRKNWPDLIKETSVYLKSSAEILNLIHSSGLPDSPELTTPSTTAESLRWAIRFAPFVRKRFSVADLIFELDMDPMNYAAQ